MSSSDQTPMTGRERIEEIVAAIRSYNADDPAQLLQFYRVMWAVVCHQTERAGQYFPPGSVDGTLYATMSEALSLYRQDKSPT